MKAVLIDAPNRIYATNTGAELLTRLAAGKEADSAKGVSIIIGSFLGPETVSKGDLKDEELKGNASNGFERGRGAGTYIIVDFETLLSDFEEKYAPDRRPGDLPVILSHELIHSEKNWDWSDGKRIETVPHLCGWSCVHVGIYC